MPKRRPRILMFDLLCVVPYYTGYLCRALQQRGVDVTLASVTYHLDPDWFNRIGVRSRAAVDSPRWFRPSHHLFRKVWTLAEYLVNLSACALELIARRPDVLHVQFIELILHGLPFEIWLLRLGRRLRIPIVYTVHDLVPHDGDPVNRQTLRRVYHLCDALIVHDRTAGRHLTEDFGIAAERIHFVPHGPLFDEPPGTREQERRRVNVAADTCVVLCQGILRSYKGIPFLLDAWREVCRHNPNALLWIAGTGAPDQVAEVTQKVADLGLTRQVRLEMRFLSVKELQNALDAADVLVYPYREITASGALMTGINYGKALVATRLPAFEAILKHEENALLVPYGDVPGLASVLTCLIADPLLRKRLGQALQRAEAQPTRWPEIAQLTLDCYEALAHE